jgi:hypothetical protein
MRITLYGLIFLLALAVGSPFARAAPIVNGIPGSIAVDAAGITYFARSGDTLISIAERLTARSANWVALGKLNRIDKDSAIPIGTGILIPADLLADEPSQAKVVALSGNVTVKLADGSRISIGLGASIDEGAQIDTGANSFLTLSLADQSRISLPSHSRVRLAKLRRTLYTGSPRTEITLLRGRVESRVTPMNAGKGRFEVRTPLSVAGVRGTHFRVGVNDNYVVNEVLSGSVTVGSPQDPQAVTLAGGMGNRIDAQSIGPAVDLLPPPQLAGMPIRQKRGGAAFAVKPFAGATAYQLQIARDHDFLHLLAEARGGAGQLTIDHIVDGDYFVRLSAIDQRGLEGLPRIQPVTLKAGAEAAAKTPAQGAPVVVSSDDKEWTLRWPGQPGRRYHIQIARVPDFSWLLFTTSLTGTEIRLPRPSFGTYYARVQSLNPDGSANPFSVAQALVVTDQWIINDGKPAPTRKMSSDLPH